jgi:hypothetical protein
LKVIGMKMEWLFLFAATLPSICLAEVSDSVHLRPYLAASLKGAGYAKLALVDKAPSGSGSKIVWMATNDDDTSNAETTREFMEDFSVALQSGSVLVSGAGNDLMIQVKDETDPHSLRNQSIPSIRELLDKITTPTKELSDLLEARKVVKTESAELNSCLEKLNRAPYKLSRWGYQTENERILKDYASDLSRIRTLKTNICK